jgi:hypothetical protein
MTEVDLAGVGIWSDSFANWDDFCAVVNGDSVATGTALVPELIPPRERRRAPQSVKLAVEVMQQACNQAAIPAGDVATVFASGMGDMQLTDYMCRTLHEMPRAVSPTKFHNSVHNAATGYWSIATGSHAPANAISAYSGSVAIALLEGAIQAVEEQLPVVVASEETAAPVAFTSIYESTVPFGSALLLTAKNATPHPLATLRIVLGEGPAPAGAQPGVARLFPGNFAAAILPLLAALAQQREDTVALPLSADRHLLVALAPGG